MKILSIGGTRPQFVKMSVLVRAFEEHNRSGGEQVEHRLLHTGQHYDTLMSDVFFEELDLPQPTTLAGIQSGSPGSQTAAMLAGVESALMIWSPDAVVIYGDTNSTLAAAIATVKLHIPLIHLEAGLRSCNRRMQEEINRIVSDHVSDLLLAPTGKAMSQLRAEGLADRAVYVGDVMLDATLQLSSTQRRSLTLEMLGTSPGQYVLVTLHRAETTDDMQQLASVIAALREIDYPVIFPVHPRLKNLLGVEGMSLLRSVKDMHLIEPVSYFEMLALETGARFILTDSGGVQKEAYSLGRPCITMRDETEWVETLTGNWNVLAGTETKSILAEVRCLLSGKLPHKNSHQLAAFGDGQAGRQSVAQIINLLRSK